MILEVGYLILLSSNILPSTIKGFTTYSVFSNSLYVGIFFPVHLATKYVVTSNIVTGKLGAVESTWNKSVFNISSYSCGIWAYSNNNDVINWHKSIYNCGEFYAYADFKKS